MGVMEDAIYPASVILSPFNLMSDFAIRLGRRREPDLKSIGAKANVIKGASERARAREAGSN